MNCPNCGELMRGEEKVILHCDKCNIMYIPTHKLWRKSTEGEGWISGDFECWCIAPMPFEEWKNQHMPREGLIYPNALFPQIEKQKVRWKITVTLEEIE